MAKKRTDAPDKIKEQVLKEFNHLCAVCGTYSPQVHHIDEDPSNHAPLNLLPLCPTNHLRDAHNPTVRIEIPKLQLFRRFKDPAILCSQFHPLYLRFKFFDSVELNDSPVDELEERAKELVEFVQALNMGAFYAQRLNKLLKRPKYVDIISGSYDPEYERKLRREYREYREQLINAREAVIGLVIELLRYQAWTNDNSLFRPINPAPNRTP